MDFVLDALLQSLTELISCDRARIWLLEGDTRLFSLRPILMKCQPSAIGRERRGHLNALAHRQRMGLTATVRSCPGHSLISAIDHVIAIGCPHRFNVQTCE